MELIRKVSKGSRMNQIYIPKERMGFNVGTYVVIKPIAPTEIKQGLFSYGSLELNPLKAKIAETIFQLITGMADIENIFIMGSFLDKGYNFNDIDIIIISKKQIEQTRIAAKITEEIGIKPHLIISDYSTLLRGISSDPLFELMMSRYVSMNRWIVKKRRTFDYKKLDLHLLKSKDFDRNFDYISGKQKYEFIRNLMAIKLFIEGKRLTHHTLDKEIHKELGIQKKELIDNMIPKEKDLIKRYNSIFKRIERLVFKGMEHESKQE